MITDVVINISSSRVNAGLVRIIGNVNIKSLIIDPSPFYTTGEYRPLTDPPMAGRADGASYQGEIPSGDTITRVWDVLQKSYKRVDMRAVLTNDHCFDPNWLETPNNSELYMVGEERDIPLSYGDIDVSDFIVPFSKTFNLNPGGNTLKMRFFVRNNSYIQSDPDMDWYINEEAWIPYLEIHEAHLWEVIMGYPYGPTHVYYPLGTLSCNYVGDPDTMRNSVVNPSMTISLTVTATDREPIIHQVSA
jgi:hypothetical protein